jgi:lysophospholipase L1-like esterase
MGEVTLDILKPPGNGISKKGATDTGFSRKTRGFFAVLFLLLWLVLAFAGLETCSRLGEKWSERHNAYITGRTPPQHAMPSDVPIILDDCRWETQASPNPPSKSLSPATDCSETEWRKCFEALGPMQRHLAADRHDCLVLEFDKTGGLVETFGFPTGKELLRRANRGMVGFLCRLGSAVSGFNTGVSEALRGAGSTRRIALPLAGVLFDAEFQPIPATGGAFAFFPNILGGASQREPLPPDSPWEVPFFRYKKGIPNMRWGVPGACHLNNAGFRGKDVKVPKPAGLYRIVCVGASTTEEGPSDDATYPALLEKKLTAAFPGHPIEVVNCGISGMSTISHLMRFADYLALEPDLMVVYEGVNDATSLFPMQWLLFDSPIWVKAAHCSHFLRQRYDSRLYGSEEKLEDDVQTFTLGRFRIMRQWALANNADMVFCSIASPPYEDLPFREREYMAFRSGGFSAATPRTYLKTIGAVNKGLKELSVNEGWGYIPVAENFHFGMECFSDLCHMYPEGTERKAEIIFRCLRERLGVLFAAAAEPTPASSNRNGH